MSRAKHYENVPPEVIEGHNRYQTWVIGRDATQAVFESNGYSPEEAKRLTEEWCARYSPDPGDPLAELAPDW